MDTRFRQAVVVMLFIIAVEIAFVAMVVLTIEANTAASPIERCIRDYGLTPEQCRSIEMGLRVPLDGGQ